MKLIKLAILASLIGCTANVMANEVVISNTSNHPIPVKYQLAYHNPGQQVVLGEISEGITYANSPIRIAIPQKHYQHAGVVVLAVKKGITDQKWVVLPASVKQFDGKLGCWARTDKIQRMENIQFSYRKTTIDGKHGVITCSVKG